LTAKDPRRRKKQTLVEAVHFTGCHMDAALIFIHILSFASFVLFVVKFHSDLDITGL